jgi:ppGpp synthetase/RelA/SpoT-type nucleotidyltranferase
LENNKNYRALKLETASQLVQEDIFRTFQQAGILEQCYAYKSRIKPEEKLLKKVELKKKAKPDYCLENITDVIGIRLVTLFRSEMPSVVEDVLNLILNVSDVSPNPFYKKGCEEIIIFTTNKSNDKIMTAVRSNLEASSSNLKKFLTIQQSNEGYSSIHVVARTTTNIPLLSIPSKQYYVPVEIQIRTVFEDAWGEIDHKYGYVQRQGKETGKPTNHPGIVHKQLENLKKFTDACSEYADIIHDVANNRVTDHTVTGSVISVEADDELIEKFTALKIPKETIDKYIDARAVKQEAISLQEKSDIKYQDQFILAAESFREIAENHPPSKGDELDGDSVFYYYVKMNEAICLMTTNAKQNIRAAQDIYFSLQEKYMAFPLLHLRIGQACEKLGLSHEAITYYQYCWANIEYTDSDKALRKKYLPDIDYFHIQNHLPLIHGYALWELSKDAETEEEKYKFLGDAVEITSKLINSDNDKIKSTALNNVLFYLVEEAGLENISNLTGNVDNLKKQIDEILKQFIALVDIEQCTDMELLDTFAVAYDFSGLTEKAHTIVDKIIGLSLDAEKQNILLSDDIILDIAQRAYGLKQKYIKTK